MADLFSGTVIYVADEIDIDASNLPKEERRDMEMSHPNTVAQVMTGLRDAGYAVLHVGSLTDLAERLRKGHEDLVLSSYAGSESRSRTTHVPSMCEVAGVPCAGLDAYGHAICLDKHITKVIAAEAGLLTPSGRVFRSKRSLEFLEDRQVPYIVKPLAEGSSIGISDANIVHDPALGAEVASRIMDIAEGPVLVEDFIEGREVTFGIVQDGDGFVSGLNEQQIIDDPDYFLTRVWDAQQKFDPTRPRHVVPIDDELHPDDHAAIHAFLKALGSFDYIRLDGRLRDGRFHFLEANPDAYLGSGGQLAAACAAGGVDYPGMFKLIVQSAYERFPRPSATG